MDTPWATPILYAALFIISTTAYFVYQMNSKPNSGSRIPLPPPSEIISLRIYPIKSCQGFEVHKTTLHKTGLDLDRKWMFIDATTRNFLTIREISEMTLIDTALNAAGTELSISIQGKKDRVTIPAYPSKEWLEQNTKYAKGTIWGAETDGYEYGADVNSIFTSFFGRPVSLVYKGPTPRLLAVNGAPELLGRTQNHHFADVMSLQVASQASIDELNGRLKSKGEDALTIERFRPNIVIRGGTPWEEDGWKRVPNVNPDTAVKHAKEPWDTLMKYRRVDDGGVAKYKPCFGMLCVPKNEGEVEVGMMVEVLETTDKHVYSVAKFKDL
ncbi:hypothetical protein B0A49_06157 [Cryomyces minteri]|uniref:MOSC domain-containing protein n=1 Tax=Cryomyces minteri TaxID=331657 RepID=A0A4U0WT86_9PEZI|nr:hypothetical protein B0A49_06157 [Cryomyces minteri]